MENNTLTITWCYPDLLNLHGDRGNIMALERIGKMLDLTVSIQKVINLEDDINFEQTDILLLNPGELKIVKPIVEALQKKKNLLDSYVEKRKDDTCNRYLWRYF